MAKRKIIWSHRAEIKLFKILEFYAERNKSRTYSARLYQRLNNELRILLKQPDVGLNTEIESVRGLIVDDIFSFMNMTTKRLLSILFGIADRTLTT